MSRPTLRSPIVGLFAYRVFTFCDPPFQNGSAKAADLMRTRAVPISLATTLGISVDFFSSGY